MEQSSIANQHGAWISCARCVLRLPYIPRHIRVDPDTSFSAGGSETNVVPERQLLYSESGEGHDFRRRGKLREKKDPPQPTIVYNTVYNSGAASSATISSGRQCREITTPPTLVSPNNSSLETFVVSTFQTERIRVRWESVLLRDVWHGKCSAVQHRSLKTNSICIWTPQ